MGAEGELRMYFYKDGKHVFTAYIDCYSISFNKKSFDVRNYDTVEICFSSDSDSDNYYSTDEESTGENDEPK